MVAVACFAVLSICETIAYGSFACQGCNQKDSHAANVGAQGGDPAQESDLAVSLRHSRELTVVIDEGPEQAVDVALQARIRNMREARKTAIAEPHAQVISQALERISFREI